VTHVAYSYERPDIRALDDLEQLVRTLLDELAGWRRRSLKAEAELQELRSSSGGTGTDLTKVRRRVAELETENQALRMRVDTARDRVRTLVGRLNFLEQGGENST
jgi:FtsZ-binding cell division protein ZapB